MQPIHTAKDYHQLGNQNPSPSGNRWGDTFGIKHLSDAEWEEYERRQKVDFDRRQVLLIVLYGELVKAWHYKLWGLCISSKLKV